ncbi:MAG: MCE family protein [Fibrobacterota bacterium]|nr:MCE family protein [Fibrobacterota bacterium]QQS06670.1 MAG: MCE family protein [Fibrobacterota bacterium]
MRHSTWKEILQQREVRNMLTGALLLGSLVVLAGAFVAYALRHELFPDNYTVYAVYEDGTGMSGGAKVLLNGVQVGTVDSVTLSLRDAQVILRLSLKRQYQTLLRRNSVAYFKRDRNMVSDRALNIERGDPSAPLLEDGDTMALGPPQDIETALGSLADLTVQFRQTLLRVDSLLLLVTDTHTTIGAVLVKDDLYRKTLTTVDHFDQAARGSNQVLERVDRIGRVAEATIPRILNESDTLATNLRRSSVYAESLGVSGLELLHSTQELTERTQGLLNGGDTLLGKGNRFMSGVERSWLLGRFMKDPPPKTSASDSTVRK